MTHKNYTQLLQLYKDFHTKGLEILCFPCNQFGYQEPGTPDEILKFVRTKFDEKIDEKLVFFEKADVNGTNAREVFRWLKAEIPDEVDGHADIPWNFSK